MKTRRPWYNILAIGCVMALLLTFVSVIPARAESPVIDNFTRAAVDISHKILNLAEDPDVDPPIKEPLPIPLSQFIPTTSVSGNVLGNQRDSCLTITAGDIDATGALLVSTTNGYMSFIQGPSVLAWATLQWDGTTDRTCDVDTDGLSPAVDLTGGSTPLNTAIRLRITNSDGTPVDLTVNIWNSGTKWTKTVRLATIVQNGTERLDLVIPYDQFDDGLGGLGTLSPTSVGAVELKIDGTISNGADFTIKLLDDTPGREYGDLPDGSFSGYPNYSAVLGAYHIPQGLRLGTSLDVEPTYNTSATATGDDTNQALPDDEDGVVRNPSWVWKYGPASGTTGGKLDITWSGGPGCLSGWIDWSNGSDGAPDGNFDDTGETILDNFYLGSATGSTTRWFAIPINMPVDGGTSYHTYFARFRIYPRDSATSGQECTTARSVTGSVTDGEVEDYAWLFSPLAVSLESFTAAPMDKSVQVAWVTVSETDNAGFNLYRATSEDGAQTQVNPKLIPAQAPGSMDGHAYEWQDADVESDQSYFYWLEDVDLNGTRTMHGPVSATYALDANKPAGPTAVRLQGLTALPISAALPWAGALILAVGAGAALLRRRR